MDRVEQVQAERISALVDEWLRDAGRTPTELEAEEQDLLDTAQNLARLPLLLGPVDLQLERRVMRVLRTQQRSARPRRRFSPAWAVAAIAVMLLVAVVTPAGQTAVASFMAVFNLGQTEVRVTPADTAAPRDAMVGVPSTAQKESLTLAEAQAAVAFAIRQPDYLPPGFRLQEVAGFSYPDLPAWMPQPFIVELQYGDRSGGQFAVRLYPITLDIGDRANVTAMNLEAGPIQDVRDVDVGGEPGVLLSLGRPGSDATWQELVWEQGDIVVVLSTSTLSYGELLDVARSVR